MHKLGLKSASENEKLSKNREEFIGKSFVGFIFVGIKFSLIYFCHFKPT